MRGHDDNGFEERRRRRLRGIRWTVAILFLIVLGFYLSTIIGHLRG